jgi:hypothetical protein
MIKRLSSDILESKNMKHKIKYILLFLSLVFMAAGTYRGEVLEVLKKAINICLECIGIG